MTATVNLDAISGDELSICVILNRRHADTVPHFMSGLEDGDAVATCWLERQFGAWIQDGGGEIFRCKREIKNRLAGLAVEPNGYSDQGSFFM